MTIILYNPLSHNKSGETEAKKWIETHNETYDQMVSVLDIDKKKVVESLTKDDKLIVFGGDGTLSRFADAVKDIELPCNIYYSPSGTGNDFLRDLPKEKATDPILINEYITKLPRVYLNGEEHVFINGIGYGLDGYCCEEGDRQQAKSKKKINYTLIALKGLFGDYKMREADVTIDGETKHFKKVWLAPTMNGRCYGGGLKITPFQDRLNEARKLTCAVVHSMGRIKIISIFLSIFDGSHVNKTDVYYAKECFETTVKFNKPCALQIDGETYLNISEYSVKSWAKLQEEKGTL